jgi:hypothetical protein
VECTQDLGPSFIGIAVRRRIVAALAATHATAIALFSIRGVAIPHETIASTVDTRHSYHQTYPLHKGFVRAI